MLLPCRPSAGSAGEAARREKSDAVLQKPAKLECYYYVVAWLHVLQNHVVQQWASPCAKGLQ